MNNPEYLPAIIQLYNSEQINLIISAKLYLIWLKTVLSHLNKDEDSEYLHVIKEIENFQKQQLSFSSFLNSEQNFTDLNNFKEFKVFRSTIGKGQSSRKSRKKVGFGNPKKKTQSFKQDILSPKDVWPRSSQSHLYSSDASKSLCDDFQLVKLPLINCCEAKSSYLSADHCNPHEESSNRIVASDGNVKLRGKFTYWLTDPNNDIAACLHSPSEFLLTKCANPMWSSSPVSYYSNTGSTPKQLTFFSGTPSLSTFGEFNSQPGMVTISEQNSLKNIDNFSPNANCNNKISSSVLSTPNNDTSLHFNLKSSSPWITPNLPIDVSDGVSWKILSTSSPTANALFSI